MQPRPRPHPLPNPAAPAHGAGHAPTRKARNAVAHVFARIGADLPFKNAQTVRPVRRPIPRSGRKFCSSDRPRLSGRGARRTCGPTRRALAVAARQGGASKGSTIAFAKTPLPVAVAVIRGRGAPPIPGHEFMGPQPGKPVMVVYGDGEMDQQRGPRRAGPPTSRSASSRAPWTGCASGRRSASRSSRRAARSGRSFRWPR